MNCEQTRKQLVLHREANTHSPELQNAALRHLRTCTACQVEYEALWHTATVLENAEVPIPPAGLLAQIQQGVRHLHKRRQVAFFANPMSWCFERMKIELSPRLVNVIAMLCYVLASAFLVKLAFFTGSPEPEFGLTAMEESRLRHVRMSRASWGLLKGAEKERAAPAAVPAQKTEPAEKRFRTAPQNTQRVNQFFTLDAVKMWMPHAVDTSETLQREVQTADQKLTVFWNHIKTSL